MNPFDLSGKIIVVTGASSGIGKQCAITCSEMGATVALIGRNLERLENTISLLPNKDSHKYFVVDLRNEVEVKDVVSRIVNTMGFISGLLNVAGISSTLLLKSFNLTRFDEIMKNNVYSAINITKEVCKNGSYSNEGCSVVFFSSVVGDFGDTGKFNYAMSKGALQSASKSLACELAIKKIRVNTISPGLIVTPINENMPHLTDTEKRITLEKKHLLGFGQPVDVANACVYLLSDASKWVTGINLYVDGGYSAI